jgi:hypothetical protein
MKLDESADILAKADAQGLRRVLIVTALPLEMKAVRAYLKPLGSCSARDGNVFELGQFNGTGHEWLVIVAESGAGNHASQGIVTTAIKRIRPAGTHLLYRNRRIEKKDRRANRKRSDIEPSLSSLGRKIREGRIPHPSKSISKCATFGRP